MKKQLAAILTASMLIGTIASVTTPITALADEGVQEITWMFWDDLEASEDNITKGFKEVVDRFNADYEGQYHVTPITTTLEEYYTQLNALVDAGQTPDVFIVSPGPNLTDYVAPGVAAPLDEYLEEKVSNLVTIYQEIKDESGVLNMESFTGKNEPISLRPMEEETGTEETDPEETQLQVQQETDGEGNAVDNSEETDAVSDDNTDQETTGVSSFMVFDSSGTLRYDALVVNGLVVDAYGNPIDGCSVEENGYVKDAYWNIIDPQTGELAQ